MQYFLAKTDPESYSIFDFAKEKTTVWDGVHNYQAMNAIKQWRVGDLVLIYHSIQDKKIMGLARVVDESFENFQDLRTSWAGKLELVRVFDKDKQISLQQIKESGLFNDFILIRQSRLSVMLCPDNFISWLKKQGLNLDVQSISED